MRSSLARPAVVVAVVLAVALGGLAGPAAADQGSSLEVDVAVSGPGGGGDGTMDCEGHPVGEHECDKHGNMSGGPFEGSYEGFNEGDTTGESYAFGDSFSFELFEKSVSLDVTCSFEREPPSENPCPIDTTP